MRNIAMLCYAFVLGALACGSERMNGTPGANGTHDAGSDAAAPAKPVAAGSGGASPIGSCSALGSCPAHSIGIWQTLSKASDFGAGARFVASGGLGVLVALADGHYRVARAIDPSGVSTAQDWDFPHASPQAQPLAVIVRYPTDFIKVLTCGEDGAHCSVWESDFHSDGMMTDWSEQVLSATFIGRGFAQAADGTLCVFGNGMYCLAKAWRWIIPESDGLRINAAALGASWSVVVGDHGRWFKSENGTWEEQAPLGDVALDQVDVSNDGGAVIIGGGKLQAALGTQAGLYDCLPDGDLAALILDPAARGLAYAVTSTGSIFQHSLAAEPYCSYQQLTLSGPVLHSDALPCGGSNNPRILTQSVWFGQNSCVEVP